MWMREGWWQRVFGCSVRARAAACGGYGHVEGGSS